MKQRFVMLLVGASVLGLSTGASAQVMPGKPAPTQNDPAAGSVPAATAPDGAPITNAPQSAQQDSTSLGQDQTANTTDVIVTARRASENLQNVPQTVTAVSGETIKKLNFTQFQDVAAAVPGLTLNYGALTSGRIASPALRGIAVDASASPSPTVDTYINDAPVGANIAYTAIYDIGDIEVLKGPQGTLRGRTAPSGAITLTTRRASTTDWGGYVSGLATDKHSINGQAALNAPIIDGILGLRVAGDVDQGDGDFVRSTGTGLHPYRNVVSGRASLAFTPASNLSFNLTYQYLSQQLRRFDQVEGTGNAGTTTPLAPANYNGPVLTAAQRLGVNDKARDIAGDTHLVTGNATWDVLGHRLEYVGSYIRDKSFTNGDIDSGNALIGATYPSILNGRQSGWTHEARLSSTGPGHLLDYSIGYFHSKGSSLTTGTQPAAALAGTFGSPAAPSPYVFNTRYLLNALITAPGATEENSFYGNATLHLGSKTEITGGVRYIINHIDTRVTVFVTGGNVAVRIPVNCSLLGYASTYPGYCDVPIAAATTPASDQRLSQTDKPVVYSASIKHRFNDDFLAYATVGSSWRRGGTNTGITNAANDPVLNSLFFTPNETSTSYEVGLKTNWLDRRLRLNIAGFYQHFNNLIFQITSIPYVQTNGQTTQVVNSNFNVGANSTVKGFDFDGAFQVSPQFSISGGVSYADGRVDNALVPCRDANFDGTPDAGSPTLAQFQAAKVSVAQCRTNQSVSRDPIWNATVQSEYHAPITASFDGYLRGLLNYFPSNDRQSAGFTVTNYVLLNLYAGLRSPDGAWDIGVFVRNATGAGVELSRDPSLITSSGNVDAVFGATGYRYTSYTPPRQVGLSVRYAFGGR